MYIDIFIFLYIYLFTYLFIYLIKLFISADFPQNTTVSCTGIILDQGWIHEFLGCRKW